MYILLFQDELVIPKEKIIMNNKNTSIALLLDNPVLGIRFPVRLPIM